MVKKRTNFFWSKKISNKLAYTLIGILILIALAIGVYSYGTSNPIVFGHSAGELGAPTGCSTGQVLTWTGSAWSCTTVSDGTSQWITSGNNIYYNTAGNVGIGISNPEDRLTVNGTFLVQNSTGGGLFQSANGKVVIGSAYPHSSPAVKTLDVRGGIISKGVFQTGLTTSSYIFGLFGVSGSTCTLTCSNNGGFCVTAFSSHVSSTIGCTATLPGAGSICLCAVNPTNVQ